MCNKLSYNIETSDNLHNNDFMIEKLTYSNAMPLVTSVVHKGELHVGIIRDASQMLILQPNYIQVSQINVLKVLYIFGCSL